jgi:hypothetical protein
MTTATAFRADPVIIGPSGLPQYTLGWEILGWTAENLLQPDGPNTGAPWRYTDEQARTLLWWYAVNEQGRFIYRRGMLRRVKGWGKDPFGATLCAIELCGPCRFGGWDEGQPVAIPHPSPWVITAAVSLDQTKNTMTLFPNLWTDDAVNEFGIDIGKEIIYTRRGMLEAVTSSPRALEGKRTTFALKNETHHWVGSNDGLKMSEVIERNNTKARGGDARSLAISNGHNPGEGSDAELDFEAFQASQTGRGGKDFYYDSREAPDGIDIADPEQVRAGLIAARGDSVWLDLDVHVATILDPKSREGNSRRFYFNQIVAGDDVWMRRSDWDALRYRKDIPDGTPVVVGFDGSDTDDWTAIRCETQSGYQFTPQFHGRPMIWDPQQHDGFIPRGQVNAAVAELMQRYKVVRMYADPPYWQSEIDEWSARYGDKTVLRWATFRIRQMSDALERFRTDVYAGNIAHDGCDVTSLHIRNAHSDPRPSGLLIRKDKAVSKNKIDAVMSSTLAHQAALDVTAAKLWPKKRKLIVMR